MSFLICKTLSIYIKLFISTLKQPRGLNRHSARFFKTNSRSHLPSHKHISIAKRKHNASFTCFWLTPGVGKTLNKKRLWHDSSFTLCSLELTVEITMYCKNCSMQCSYSQETGHGVRVEQERRSSNKTKSESPLLHNLWTCLMISTYLKFLRGIRESFIICCLCLQRKYAANWSRIKEHRRDNLLTQEPIEPKIPKQFATMPIL